jgi:glycosyltransferase involved in cell wall biosynthesis
MIKLTAAIITYNEAKNIERCLKSLQTVADELLVVDSFSTDGTQQIAKNMGATVIEHKFEGHIEQKNWAISQAKYPHVLSLDADEALDEQLKKSILAAKENWSAPGYTLNRFTNYCGTWIKHGNWYPDVKLRLWDSRLGKWGGQNPHDEYQMPEGTKIENLNGHLLHYSFYHFEEHLAQIKKFTDISSLAAFKRGKRSNLFKIIFSPTLKFLKGYFFKAGFLDGKAGWMIARWSAYATYLKYTKLLNHQKNKHTP